MCRQSPGSDLVGRAKGATLEREGTTAPDNRLGRLTCRLLGDNPDLMTPAKTPTGGRQRSARFTPGN